MAEKEPPDTTEVERKVSSTPSSNIAVLLYVMQNFQQQQIKVLTE